MKSISGEESERRWKILTERTKSTLTHGAPTAQQQENPFDCSHLVVPTSQTLIGDSINQAIKQWKELEQRKVVTLDQNSSSNNKRSRPDEPIRWGWHANRLRLPEFFDYETREDSPPEDDGTGERVVSLEDPSIHLSLEQELWKIFRQVPTLQELEANAMDGAECHRMRTVHVETVEGTQKYSRMDCHALSRLRMSDRHGLPQQTSNDCKEATTIRMECWRRHLKRGPSPDSNRLQLEFLGSQTLEDVHEVIVELSNDELWDDSSEEKEKVSGLFFIEDTFYIAGTVDYAATVLAWLDDKDAGQPRRGFLGLPVNEPLQVKPMSSIRLEQLQWRLGVRYFHAHHGDVECSVFLTDIRRGWISPKVIYPIVHDVWSPSYFMVECEACRRRVGILCTSASNKLTDGGPRALCEPCCQQLYPSGGDAQSSACIIKYSVWRDQEDLSVGHLKTDAVF